ncbi:MAG: hypothetical protein P4K80_02410 [Acidobacteriaceae bacterium]|nr:hypothetical protein [Acidobacteriaceae bacterium]
MMTRSLVRLIALSCVCIGMGVAQAPVTPSTPKPRFAIAMPIEKGYPPIYLTVPEVVPNSNYIATCGTYLYGENLHHMANPDPTVRQPSLLQLECKAEGDQVSITATVYYGEVDPKTGPTDWGKLEKQPLDSYSGKLNDSITLSAMARVGLEPMTLKIVSAQSEHPYQPLTRSNAPSLDMEYAPFDRSSGTLTIHNHSSKAVVALEFSSSNDSKNLGCLDDCNDGWSEGAESRGRGEVIAPGASYQHRVSNNPSWKDVNGKRVELPLPTYLTLTAVVFSDGSYEGNLQTSAQMAATNNGSMVQRQRILSLIHSILAETQSDDLTTAERIRTEVKQLSTDPDVQMIAELRSQFPTLSDEDLAQLKNNLSMGMKQEKETLDYSIAENEHLFASDASDPRSKHHHQSLASLLASVYEHVEQPAHGATDLN